MCDSAPDDLVQPHESYIYPAIRGKCRSRDADRVIAGLAQAQHGVVSRRQLLAEGIRRRAIEERLKRNRLHRIHAGVYAVGHPVLGHRGVWLAAVLAGGDGAVLSHRAAGQLWQMLSWNGVFVDITRSRNFRTRPGIAAHRSTLPADERGIVDGIPVTSVPRTILDLAGVLDRRRLERALNEIEVQGITDALSLPDLLARYPRRPGSALLRAVLADLAAGRGATVNEFEALFAGLITTHDLPIPRFNADLSVRGRLIRPDAIWDRERVIVELDGRAVHGTALAFETDRERDRLLLADDWRVVRVTWRQLRDDPARIATDLRTVLGRAATSTL